MAGYPRSDIEADNWQTITPENWSWLDHVKAYGHDAGNALSALTSNLVEGLSPFAPTATQYGKPSLQVPPMLQGLADSYGRLAGTPSKPGNAWDLTGVKEHDAPIQADMSNALLSLYGGNAAAGLGKLSSLADVTGPSLARSSPTSTPRKSVTLHGGSGQIEPYDGPTFPRAAWALERRDAAIDGLADYISNRKWSGYDRREAFDDAYHQMVYRKAEADNNLHINLQAKRAGGTEPFYYDIRNPDGTEFGNARGSVVGDTMNFEWLGGPDGANALGVSGVRALREQVRNDFPGVSKFTGHRVSGARDKANAHNRTQIVELLSDTGKPSIFGSALATAGEQPFDLNELLTRYGAY